MNRHRFDFWILAHRSFVAVCLACSLACWCDLARSQVQQQGGVQQGGQQGGQQAGGQQGVGNNGNQAGAGGVVIDARGVLRVNAVLDAGLSLPQRKAAGAALPAELQKRSKLRKVALSRLEAEVAKAAAGGRGIPEEMLQLAGLTRVQYVFIYPGEGSEPG